MGVSKVRPVQTRRQSSVTGEGRKQFWGAQKLRSLEFESEDQKKIEKQMSSPPNLR